MPFKPESDAPSYQFAVNNVDGINTGWDGRMSPTLSAAYLIVGLCVAVPPLAVPIGAVAAGAAFQAVKQHIAD